MNDPKDYGTPEIAKRFTVVPKLSQSSGMHMKVADDTEIDRLLLRDEINMSQHATLEGFMRRLHKMGFVGVRSPDYESPINLDPAQVGDRRANAVRGMVSIFRRLDDRITPTRRREMVNLCLMDTPWPGDQASLHDCIGALDDVIAGR